MRIHKTNTFRTHTHIQLPTSDGNAKVIRQVMESHRFNDKQEK